MWLFEKFNLVAAGFSLRYLSSGLRTPNILRRHMERIPNSGDTILNS